MLKYYTPYKYKLVKPEKQIHEYKQTPMQTVEMLAKFAYAEKKDNRAIVPINFVNFSKMNINPRTSTPFFIWLYSKPSAYLRRRPIQTEPSIADYQVMVYDRYCEHNSNKKVFDVIARLDVSIKKLCKKTYRYDLLKLVATAPLPDLIELDYLLTSRTFFKHYKKFEMVYQSLKIKNIKNRHHSNINMLDENYSIDLLHKTGIAVIIPYAPMKTSASTSDNFLLDFGFVESVGSVLLLLKVY